MFTLQEVLAKVKVNDETGCWEWTLSKYADGYGRHFVNRKGRRVHRTVYEMMFGPFPDSLSVLHRCDNPSCCNPSHLFLGTHQTNMADRTAKGRAARGENHGLVKRPERRATGDRNAARLYPEKHVHGEQHHSAKMNATSVLECVRLRNDGMTFVKIAKLFGVTPPVVRAICNGTSWAHIPRNRLEGTDGQRVQAGAAD